MNRGLRIATRILLGLLVVILLVVAGLQIALSTEGVQEYLRTRLEAMLSRRLQQEVQVGQVRLSPFLTFLELRRVGVSDPERAPLFPQIGSVRFYPNLGRLLRGVPAFRNVVFLRPVINFSEGVGVPRGRPRGWILRLLLVPSNVQNVLGFQVDRLQIREGKLTYRREGQVWNVQGLDADLWHEKAEVRGELRVAEGDLHLSQGSLTWGNLEASVVLGERDLTITHLGFDVGGGTVGVVGRVRNAFEGPRLELDLSAQLPLTSLVSLPGTIRLGGKLTGSAQAPRFQGVALVRGAKWPDLGIKLSADGEGVQGKDLSFLSSPGEVSGTFHLQWKDLSYAAEIQGERLDLDLFTPSGPGGLPVSGMLAVQAVAEGQGGTTADLTAQVTFQVTSLQRRGQPSIAWTAEGLVKADRGRLSLERLQVDLPPNRLTIQGSLWEELNLEVSGRFPRVDLVGRLLMAKKELGGKGKVVGRVRGPLKSPTFQGTLTWDAPRLLGRDFRQISGEIRVENRTLIAPRLLVTKGKSSGTLHLRLALAEKQAPLDLKHDLRIEAEGQVRGAARDLLSFFVPTEIPLAGQMTLDASVEGVPARLEGRGHVKLKDATLLGEPWQAVDADLVLEPTRLLFKEVRLTRGADQVTGSGVIHLKDRETTFHLAAPGLSLKRFRLLAGTGLGGQMRVEIRGEGRLENPTIHADYELTDLRYSTIPLGSGRGSLLLQDRKMTAELVLPKRGYSASGSLEAFRPYAYNVEVTMKRAELAPLFALTGFSLLKGSRGTGSGTAQVVGNLKARRPSQITLDLEAPSLRLHGQTFHTTQPIHLEMTKDTLTIASLAVTGKGGWLNARGKIAFRGAVDVDVDGKIPLGLLRAQELIAGGSGAADLKLKVSGSWASPRYQGRVKLQGARLRLKGHPEKIQGITGQMDFKGTKIRIPRLIGRWAGGEVKFSGTASRRRGRGWRWVLDLQLDGADARRVFAWEKKGKARVTGRMALWGKVTAEGKRWEELQQSVRGKFRLALREGKVRRYTVLAHIVRILNLTPDPSGGIPYDRLDAVFDLKGGVAETQDLKFVSNTANISGVGKIDLGRGEVDMLLGVQPLTIVDKAVSFLRLNKIPLLGRLLFGKEESVLVIAVEVKGPLANPEVAAVPEESLGRGVFGILHRVLELPRELLPAEKSGSP